MNLTNLLTLVCLAAVLAVIITCRSDAAQKAVQDAIAMVTGDDTKAKAEAIGISKQQLELLRPMLAAESEVADPANRLAMARYYGTLEHARRLNEARTDDLRWAQQVAITHASRTAAPSYRAVYKSAIQKGKKRPQSMFERSQQYKVHGSAYDNDSGRFRRVGGRTLRGGGARRR